MNLLIAAVEPWVWIAAGGGSVLGIAGGLYGTWCSIKNTKGPRERSFVIREAWRVWIILILWLAALILIPKPWGFLMWIPYGVFLPWWIKRFNRIQHEIRVEEAKSDE